MCDFVMCMCIVYVDMCSMCMLYVCTMLVYTLCSILYIRVDLNEFMPYSIEHIQFIGGFLVFEKLESKIVQL